MTDLRALLNNATPPPWTLEILSPDEYRDEPEPFIGMEWNGKFWVEDSTLLSHENAALIVALVNQAHALLDVVEAAREFCEGTDDLISAEPLYEALARLDQQSGDDPPLTDPSKRFPEDAP